MKRYRLDTKLNIVSIIIYLKFNLLFIFKLFVMFVVPLLLFEFPYPFADVMTTSDYF